ncbi:MAG: 50S ribosomal protein L10 [Leptospiraceae bacterium]|nr:50S ribosomal protein L10 [Leptospiraceae bacterium]MDW7975162.1 50S ribosomal protein L10 [Leptospiraceae bacterium]
MPSRKNVQLVKELKEIIEKKPNLIMTTYTGLTVEQLTELRKKLKEKKATTKVVKNTIFKIVLKDSPHHEYEEKQKAIEETIRGPLFVAFAGDELPSIAKVIIEESKKDEKIQLRGGYFEGKFLDSNEIKSIAGLPTKEELLTIIARGLNTPAQRIAIGMKEIITRIARGIQQIAEKQNS